VLLTNLANLVQPLVRYEIGDIVTMATEPCDCGNHLPLIARVDLIHNRCARAVILR